jgi:hypothetical protein
MFTALPALPSLRPSLPSLGPSFPCSSEPRTEFPCPSKPWPSLPLLPSLFQGPLQTSNLCTILSLSPTLPRCSHGTSEVPFGPPSILSSSFSIVSAFITYTPFVLHFRVFVISSLFLSFHDSTFPFVFSCVTVPLQFGFLSHLCLRHVYKRV